MSGGGAELCYHLSYGLRANPFNITPDPHYLYLTDASREALAALRYGVEARKGFVVVLGEVGTGKTTLLRTLLGSLDPAVRPVLVFHPRMTFVQLLEYVSTELGLPVTSRTKLGMLRTLQAHLLEQLACRNTVALLVDEAQDIDVSVLEDLRLLSNMETDTDKVVQLVLCGQPELEAKLHDSRLRQLRQRVAVTVRLRGLESSEVGAYIERRLERAGSGGRRIFRRRAVRAVARLSRGNPRQINLICDHALRLGAMRRQRRVGRSLVIEGHSLLLPEPPPSAAVAVRWSRQALRAAALLMLAVGAGGALGFMSGDVGRLAGAALGWAGRVGSGAAVVPAALPAGGRRRAEDGDRRLQRRSAPTRRRGRATQRRASSTPPAGLSAGRAYHRQSEPERRARSGMPATPRSAEAARPHPTHTVGAAAPPPEPRAGHAGADENSGAASLASASSEEERSPAERSAADSDGPAPDDALALLENFRRRVEERDLDGLAHLLADAAEDGSRGRAAILDEYAALFARARRVGYVLRPILVQQVGDRIFVKVQAGLEIDGRRGPVRTMGWWLERSDGELRISRLSYEPGGPGGKLPPRRPGAAGAGPTASGRAQSAPIDQDH